MTGRFGYPAQVDNCHLWTKPPASSREYHHHQPLVSDSSVNKNNIPNVGGDFSRSTQPQLASSRLPESQSHRGFGLMTGVPRKPEILINDFNKEAYTIMASETGTREFRPKPMPRSPTLTLTQDIPETGDLSFYVAFEEDATISPALGGRPFSRTDLGIPSSQPLSRNGSQASSRLQDDAVSLTFSSASADDLPFPFGSNYCTPTPATSFSQTSMGVVPQFAGTSPVMDNGQWHSQHSDLASTSPTVGFSASCDFQRSFSTDFSSSIPRSTPRRQTQQSALSQSLQNMATSPAPVLPEPDLSPDPLSFDLPLASGEEALSASFAWLDSQNVDAAMMPDLSFTNINVTPPHPMDEMAVEDSFGTSPAEYHLFDYAPYTQPASHSFPAPQPQMSDDLLAPPLARRRRPRAFSASLSRSPSGASGSRTSTSTNPIPIPKRPPQARHSLPRSLPGSAPHSHSRGRRKGPMEETARQSAKRTRNEKTICIRCKGSKQRCHRPEDQADASCENCEKVANSPNKRPGPCTKAYFEDLVLHGSLNVKYHHDFTHLSVDHQQRIHKTLAPEFSLDNLLRVLDRAKSRFNLRVYHGDKRVYGLNLDTCYRYLKKVNDQLQSREEPEGDFSRFLDKDLVSVDSKMDEWMSTLTEAKPSPREDIVELYLAMSSMPEHATFYYTSKANHGNNVEERMINPANLQEKDFLELAASLARIIYRKVEVHAMIQLQKDLHDILQQQGVHHHKLVTFLHRLGCILVSLRPHATPTQSFIGAPPHMPSPTESRVSELCRVLYAYYHVFRRRLSEPLGSAWEDTLKGTWTRASPPEPLINISPSSPFAFQSALLFPGLGEASHAAPGIWNMFPLLGADSTACFDEWMASTPSGSPTYL